MTKRTRYDYDIRRGTRRRDTDYSGGVVVVVVVLILSMLGVFFGILAKQTNDAATGKARKQAHDSLTATATYDGQLIRWYVLIDPDTGMQYLVNDRGGCCPRLDADGEQMGVTDR